MRICALLLCLLLATSCHPASTASPPFQYAESSYPTKPGSRWVMQMRHFEGDRLVATWEEETVLKSVQGDLLEYVVTSRMQKQVVRSRFYVVKRPDALYYKAESPPEGGGIEGTSLLLKFPLVPDQHWAYEHPAEGDSSRTVMDQQSITIPAGTFRAVRIKETRPTSEGYSWYVSDIGMVKSDLTGKTARYEKELVKYAPGP